MTPTDAALSDAAAVWALVDARRDAYTQLSDRIWDLAEPAYAETQSCAEHVAMLEREGFRVTTGVAGIPTAVIGEAGEGGPVIAFLGEYDALPGLSQQAGRLERDPVPGASSGQGCGHNLLGAGSLLAAAACRAYLAERGIAGRVRYYGCPAEEGGAAKAFMVRDGAFADVDAAVTWHPSAFCRVDTAGSLANMRVDFTFDGRAAHAATAAHLGRSALDAVELMSVGVNYLREHMTPDARVHGAILDAGGIAPNVVQAHTKVRYLIRVRSLPQLPELVARVMKVAEGAALMTETTMRSTVVSAVSDLLPNRPLEKAMHDNLTRLGPPPFDAADEAFAREVQGVMSPDDVTSAFRAVLQPPRTGVGLCDLIVPLDADGTPALASTDVGDVSWAVPTVQGRGATYAIGTPGHSWLLTAQGKTPAAHKGMIHAAKAMARTALDVIVDEALLARAKADHQARLRESPFVSPLPPDATPPLGLSDGAG